MLQNSSGRRAPLAVALLGAALFLPFLGSFGLWDPYEVKIADLAKEVASSPGWVVPARLGLRPPLPLWLLAVGYRFLGTTELAGRLPVALASVAALCACFFAGAGLLRRRGALIGTVALATSPIFFLGARQLTSTVAPTLAGLLAVGGIARAAWPREGEDVLAQLGAFGLGLIGLLAGFYSGGMGLGVAVPLAAVAIALLVAGDAAPRGARAAATVAGLAAIAGTLVAWWKALPGPGHAGGYSPILGGLARPASHQVQYVSLLKQIGFGAFPWVALLPVAAARVFARLGAPAADEAAAGAAGDRSGARDDYGRMVLLAWVLVAYLADTLFAASVADVGFGAYAAIALLAGYLLDELWEDPGTSPVAGLAVALGAALIAHDLFMTPELGAGAHVLDGIKWPGPLVHEPYLFLAGGLAFAALVGVGLAVRPRSDGDAPSLRAPRRQTLLGGGLVAALALTLANTCWVIPQVSHHLSYKGLFTKFKSLVGTGSSSIGRYHVPGQLSEYGKTTELASLPMLFDFLGKRERVFVIAAADDLAPIDQFAKSREGQSDTPSSSYYVVDDSNSRFLMLSNQVGPTEHDLNPLRRFILKTLPRQPQHELRADFESKVELIGYDLPPELERGRTFKITLYYRVLAPVGGAFKSFIHFDGSGTRFNGDHVPLEGRFPTNYWVPGFYILDEHTMEPDRATAPAGFYQIYTGFWQGDTRLKVVSGPQDGENRVKLGFVKVK